MMRRDGYRGYADPSSKAHPIEYEISGVELSLR